MQFQDPTAPLARALNAIRVGQANRIRELDATVKYNNSRLSQLNQETEKRRATELNSAIVDGPAEGESHADYMTSLKNNYRGTITPRDIAGIDRSYHDTQLKKYYKDMANVEQIGEKVRQDALKAKNKQLGMNVNPDFKYNPDSKFDPSSLKPLDNSYAKAIHMYDVYGNSDDYETKAYLGTLALQKKYGDILPEANKEVINAKTSWIAKQDAKKAALEGKLEANNGKLTQLIMKQAELGSKTSNGSTTPGSSAPVLKKNWDAASIMLNDKLLTKLGYTGNATQEQLGNLRNGIMTLKSRGYSKDQIVQALGNAAKTEKGGLFSSDSKTLPKEFMSNMIDSMNKNVDPTNLKVAKKADNHKQANILQMIEKYKKKSAKIKSGIDAIDTSKLPFQKFQETNFNAYEPSMPKVINKPEQENQEKTHSSKTPTQHHQSKNSDSVKEVLAKQFAGTSKNSDSVKEVLAKQFAGTSKNSDSVKEVLAKQFAGTSKNMTTSEKQEYMKKQYELSKALATKRGEETASNRKAKAADIYSYTPRDTTDKFATAVDFYKAKENYNKTSKAAYGYLKANESNTKKSDIVSVIRKYMRTHRGKIPNNPTIQHLLKVAK